jgi:hypothetical protein
MHPAPQTLHSDGIDSPNGNGLESNVKNRELSKIRKLVHGFT